MTTQQDRESDCVELMRSAAGQAKSYVEGMTKENFLGDPKTQDAVILKLLVIGELAAQLLGEHAEFTARFPKIPWSQRKVCETEWRMATLNWTWTLSGTRFRPPFLTWKPISGQSPLT